MRALWVRIFFICPMEPVERKWQCRPVDCEALARLQKSGGLHPLVTQVLAHRGVVDSQDIRPLLQSRLQDLPDPSLMQDMDRAADRIAAAILQKELIAVHGDYDVDGMTACALVTEGIRSMGGRADFFIPHRMADGYGLSAEALKQSAEEGAKVAISVDCGVTALEEADLARSLGLDLIITDHHQPSERLPEAYSVINPLREGDAFPDKSIAGVGVAFFLLIAVRRKVRALGGFLNLPEPDLRSSLDLVALGTVADVVPLTGVNRLLVRAGLREINLGRRPGLAALKKASGVVQVNAGTLGYQFGPRLNAAGRLDDATRGVRLLLTECQTEAQEIAATLDGLNQERRDLEKSTLDEAISLLKGVPDACSIVLAREGWHPGVIGIVASRLVERFYRPTVLIALNDGEAKGSCRTAGGFHLYEGVARCAESLQVFGGHQAAAGVTLDPDKVEVFREAFESVVSDLWPPEDRQPVSHYDGEIRIRDLTLAGLRQLDSLAPYGMGNASPVFRLSGVTGQDVRVVGEDHLRFSARQDGATLACIAFGQGDRAALFDSAVNLLVTPEINRWRGREQLQLRVKAIQMSLKGSSGCGKE